MPKTPQRSWDAPMAGDAEQTLADPTHWVPVHVAETLALKPLSSRHETQLAASDAVTNWPSQKMATPGSSHAAVQPPCSWTTQDAWQSM